MESRYGRIFRMMLEAAAGQFKGLGGFFLFMGEIATFARPGS